MNLIPQQIVAAIRRQGAPRDGQRENRFRRAGNNTIMEFLRALHPREIARGAARYVRQGLARRAHRAEQGNPLPGEPRALLDHFREHYPHIRVMLAELANPDLFFLRVGNGRDGQGLYLAAGMDDGGAMGALMGGDAALLDIMERMGDHVPAIRALLEAENRVAA